MYKFSLIIPCYNTHLFLRKCLESIINQTYKDFEAIVVDDGSTDGSEIICDEFSRLDKRIKVFHQDNSGVCTARNLGLKNAQGEYVIFIDSDDYVDSLFLGTISEVLSGEDLLFWGDSFLFSDGCVHTHQPYDSFSVGREDVETRILQLKKNEVGYEYFGYTWNKAFRADIIRKNSICFHKDLSFREDEIFTAEYCRYVKSLRVISTPLYSYRIIDNSLRKNGRTAKMIEMYCDCLKEVNNAWSMKELAHWESYRYVSFLFQTYQLSDKLTDKWRIAQKIRKEYITNKNCNLQPSRFFTLPHLLFNLILFGKLCVKSFIA